jgi:hypothetical protein
MRVTYTRETQAALRSYVSDSAVTSLNTFMSILFTRFIKLVHSSNKNAMNVCLSVRMLCLPSYLTDFDEIQYWAATLKVVA